VIQTPPSRQSIREAEASHQRNRKKTWIIVGAILAFIGIFAFGRSHGMSYTGLNPEVRYEVTGPFQNGSYTIQTPTGRFSQEADIPLKTDNETGLTYKTFHRGSFLYISVQSEKDGLVTCSIYVDGKLVSSNSSSGQYSIVMCSGVA
jgi:hypothetical protein